MIEDEELRAQYRSESAEHLQRIEQGLLILEREPSRTDVLEAVLRDLHSLKGDARILGLEAIESLAHAGEDWLRPAYQGKQQLVSDEVKRLFPWLDALRALAAEAVGGPPAGIDFEAAVAQLEGGIVPPVPAKPNAPGAEPSGTAEDYHVDTIRVATARLDALLVDTGELLVTRGRLEQRLRELEAIGAHLEEWDLHLRRIGGRLHELDRARTGVEGLCGRFGEDLGRLRAVSDQIAGDAHGLRLLPFSSLFQLFARNVRDLAEAERKDAELVIEGGETRADKAILEALKDPLIHLVRNAVHHGIEPAIERERAGKPARACVTLRAERRESGLVVEVQDDGQGLNAERLQREAVARGLLDQAEAGALTLAQTWALILLPGLSTDHYVTNVSGRGIGMDVVREKVEGLKGAVEIDSQPQRGTTVRLRLPTTLISTHILLVEVRGNLFGIPTESVQTSLPLDPVGTSVVGGQPTLVWQEEAVRLVQLERLLEIAGEASGAPADSHYCVVLRWSDRRLGLLVDAVVDEQEVIVKPTGALLKRVRNVTGSAILGTGDICMVLNPLDLFESARRQTGAAAGFPVQPPKRRPRILLVEDSLITRTQEARILAGAGYEVITAVDGLDGWRKLLDTEVDGVVTDILMPNLDGLGLTRRIRDNAATSELPVVLVTTLASEEDRRRGLQVGADAYIVKSLFEQEALLATLRRLVD